jgi:hypothetical protein
MEKVHRRTRKEGDSFPAPNYGTWEETEWTENDSPAVLKSSSDKQTAPKAV